jgi:hypothetical protein
VIGQNHFQSEIRKEEINNYTNSFLIIKSSELINGTIQFLCLLYAKAMMSLRNMPQDSTEIGPELPMFSAMGGD